MNPEPQEVVIIFEFSIHRPAPPAVALAVFALAGLTMSVGCDRSPAPEREPETAEQSASAAADQSRRGPSTNGHYFVEVLPEPNPIPFQELFELTVEVYESEARETRLDDVTLDQVRARMPAHDHGMKTAPEVVQLAPGRFVVEGMRFHMRGDDEDGRWVVELVLGGNAGIDDVQFEYQCCVAP